jgi:TPR repeat protein
MFARLLTPLIALTAGVALTVVAAPALAQETKATPAQVETWFRNGVNHFTGREGEVDYREASHWFRRAAEAGHPIAMGYLGYLYDRGLGVEKDDEEAVKWYRRAA